MDHNPLPFAPTEETRMLQDLVARFVDKELIPLEPAILKREAEGKGYKLSEEEETRLLARCKELGLWGLDVGFCSLRFFFASGRAEQPFGQADAL